MQKKKKNNNLSFMNIMKKIQRKNKIAIKTNYSNKNGKKS